MRSTGPESRWPAPRLVGLDVVTDPALDPSVIEFRDRITGVLKGRIVGVRIEGGTFMGQNKINLENTICRAAIRWERAHAEEPGLTDATRSADTNLVDAVQAYRTYLVEEALPVEPEKAEAERDRLHAQMYSSQPYYYDYWKKELAENERLRARIVGLEDPCAVAGRHVCGPGDAEARINAALALHETRDGMCGCGGPWPCKTVKALQGESKLHGGDGDSCPICSTKQARINAALTIYDLEQTNAQTWWQQIAGDMANVLRGEGGSDAE